MLISELPSQGDDLYGGLRDDIPRQALHCGRMSFSDPLTGEPITVSSELPGDIKALFPTGGIIWKR